MRSEFPVFLLFFSLLHAVYTFPSAYGNFGVCKRGNGNFPKPGSSCRSYYKCKNWKAIEETCPGDQVFFPARGYCVWPEEFTCNEKPIAKECSFPDGKFLKPGTRCKVYFDCRKGKPTEKTCKGELLFDHKRAKCDWPELVTCPEQPKSKNCLLPNGKFLKSGTECKKFYDCRNGVATEKGCPGDQLFDPSKQTCEWPDLYTCIEDPEAKECPRPNGKFLRPGTRCKIYYHCREGVATEKRCPKDQLFDPDNQKCEWPEIYTCVEDLTTTVFPVSSTRVPTTDSDESSSEEGDSSEENIETTVPPALTTKKPTSDSDESSSEEGNSSNEDIKSTVRPELTTKKPTRDSDESSSEEENSSEEKTTTVLPVSTTETLLSTVSDENSSEENIISTTVPSVSSTETLITVSDENSSEENIISTTVSSVLPTVTSTTVSDENSSERDNRTSTKVENTSTTTAPEISTPPNPYSDAVTDTVSEKISTKEGGSTDDIKEKFTYSEVTSVKSSPPTEPPENKDSESTTVTSEVTDSVTVDIFCPRPNGYFPHPNNRHKFVACVGGIPTVMDCPADLVYDHEKRSCEYDI